MSNSVTVRTIKLEDHFKEVLAQCGVEKAFEAAEAGGHVVEAYAKINAERVFSKSALQNLAGSIHTVRSGPAEVDVGPGVIYGRIQELGGIIKTVHAKWLTFQTEDGLWHRVKEVHLPARPYLRPAVDEHMPEILEAIGNKLKEGIESVTGS